MERIKQMQAAMANPAVQKQMALMQAVSQTPDLQERMKVSSSVLNPALLVTPPPGSLILMCVAPMVALLGDVGKLSQERLQGL